MVGFGLFRSLVCRKRAAKWMRALFCLSLMNCVAVQSTSILKAYSCQEDFDCGNSMWTCLSGKCSRKSLFPLTFDDILGSVFAFCAIAISAGGGLGGGGLLVPTYIFILGMTPHDAIPLSKATIFGSSIASLVINLQKHHPFAKNRPLIDYESMLMMEPMTLAGTIIGVNLNTVLPEVLISVLLVILLTKTSIRTYNKGLKVLSQEILYEKSISFKLNDDHIEVLPYAKSAKVCYVEVYDESVSSDLHNKHLSLEDLIEYKQSIPGADIAILVCTWIGLFVFSMLKGGHGAPSIIGLKCGSAWYWILLATAIPLFVLVTIYFGLKIVLIHTQMKFAGYQYEEGDVVWNVKNAVKFPALCMLAGVSAGMLGIGGGMIKGPLLLEMGLLPEVAAATSATMILFTSSATTVQFIVLGMLPHDFALWYGCIGFLSGLVGQITLSYFVKKYKKTAFVIFLISIIIGASALIMGILGFKNAMHSGNSTQFGSICPNK